MVLTQFRILNGLRAHASIRGGSGWFDRVSASLQESLTVVLMPQDLHRLCRSTIVSVREDDQESPQFRRSVGCFVLVRPSNVSTSSSSVNIVRSSTKGVSMLTVISRGRTPGEDRWKHTWNATRFIHLRRLGTKRALRSAPACATRTSAKGGSPLDKLFRHLELIFVCLRIYAHGYV